MAELDRVPEWRREKVYSELKMVQIIPQDVPAGTRFAQALLPPIGEGFGQGFGDIGKQLVQQQIREQLVNKAVKKLGKDVPQFMKDMFQAQGMLSQQPDFSRAYQMLLAKEALGQDEPETKQTPAPPPQQFPQENQMQQTPSGRQVFGGERPMQQSVLSPAYGRPTQQPPIEQQQQQANAYTTQDFKLGNQGKLTAEGYKKAAILDRALANQVNEEARNALMDPQRELIAEQAADDQLKESFRPYFEETGLTGRDQNTFLNFFKDHFAGMDMPLSKKTRLAENAFSDYVNTRNRFSDQLQRDAGAILSGDISDRKKDIYRNTARVIMDMGDQELFYEIANTAGLTPTATEDLINPLRETLTINMEKSLPKIDSKKYLRKGTDMNQLGQYLNDIDKATSKFSDYMLDNLRGTDSLLLLAEHWMNKHGGSIDSFNKAITRAQDNGLKLSGYQSEQLQQLAENPFLNRLYESGSIMKAFFGR